MKRLFFSLMVITLMVGMSFSAMAEGICPGPVTSEIPVDMTIAPWTKVEFEGEFNFDEVNFCTDKVDDYRLWYINSEVFTNRGYEGANKALVPDDTQGRTWADVVNTHVNENDDGETIEELNPALKITTNTQVDIDLEFVGVGTRDMDLGSSEVVQPLNWPEELPTMIAIWAYEAFHNPAGNVMSAYVGHFGQNVTLVDNVDITDSAGFTINGPAQLEYHLDAGILFDENFWHYAADDYRAKIVCTVAYPQ